MSSTVFVNGVTLTDAGWFNDENDAIYKGVGLTGYSTVASATTPDIFATTVSGLINYTGTTTCTGFTAAPSAGARRVLVCAGAAVFTAGSNMLIDGVSSGSNLTCAANDLVYVYAVTTTQFRLSRSPYAGISGDFVKIGSTQTASSSASIDFTSASYATAFNGTYDTICFKMIDVVPASNASAQAVRVSQSSSFLSDGGYSWATTDGSASAQTLAQLHSTSGESSTTANSMSGEFWITGMNNSTTYKKMYWRLAFINSAGSLMNVSGSGVYSTNTTAIDGIRFINASGNIASGKFACYGVTK